MVTCREASAACSACCFLLSWAYATQEVRGVSLLSLEKRRLGGEERRRRKRRRRKSERESKHGEEDLLLPQVCNPDLLDKDRAHHHVHAAACLSTMQLQEQQQCQAQGKMLRVSSSFGSKSWSPKQLHFITTLRFKSSDQKRHSGSHIVLTTLTCPTFVILGGGGGFSVSWLYSFVHHSTRRAN